MNKFQMTDAKSGLNLKNGKIDMSLYLGYNHEFLNQENQLYADLLLSLLGGYNVHGRQFDLKKFKELQSQFNDIIEQAGDILREETTEDREEREYEQDSQKGVLF